ncbi:MAG: hypothetical protein AAF614_08755 [Chloroflexota bacterium]
MARLAKIRSLNFMVQAFDSQGNVGGYAVYDAQERAIIVQETAVLLAAKRARRRFRQLVAAQTIRLDWTEIKLELADKAYRLVHWGDQDATKERLITAYQAIWVNADVYQKVFTKAESWEILRQLQSGFVLLDEETAVCGLVAGWPILQTPAADFAQMVCEPKWATYLAEWGLSDSSAHSPLRGLGLGSFLLTLYLHALVAAGQREVVLGTAETGYVAGQQNVARPLYEAHGFMPCRDENGRLITKPVTQRRLDGKLHTHRSLLYRATADSMRMALRPETEPIEGFRFRGSYLSPFEKRQR